MAIAEKLASDQNMEHLKAVATKQFRELKIEPPTSDRMERLIRSACTMYEQTLFAEVMQRLSQSTRTLLDDLLTRSTAQALQEEEQLHDDEPLQAASQERQHPITWQDLKTNPGAVGLESVLHEIAKVRVLTQLALPADLFEQVSPKVVTLYRQRASDSPGRITRHAQGARWQAAFPRRVADWGLRARSSSASTSQCGVCECFIWQRRTNPDLSSEQTDGSGAFDARTRCTLSRAAQRELGTSLRYILMIVLWLTSHS